MARAGEALSDLPDAVRRAAGLIDCPLCGCVMEVAGDRFSEHLLECQCCLVSDASLVQFDPKWGNWWVDDVRESPGGVHRVGAAGCFSAGGCTALGGVCGRLVRALGLHPQS